MAGLPDPDDLLDSKQVADLIGWESFRSVATYRARYPDRFPKPYLDRGRCKFWRRADIGDWVTARRATPGDGTADAVDDAET